MARQKADFNWRGYGRIFLIAGLVLGVWTVWPATLCTFHGIDEDVDLTEVARNRPLLDPDEHERSSDLTRVSSSSGFFGSIRDSARVCFGSIDCDFGEGDTPPRVCADAAPIAEQEDWKRYGAAGGFGLWILFGFGARMQLRRDARRMAER